MNRQEAFKRVTWVFRGVSLRAEACAAVPFEVRRRGEVIDPPPGFKDMMFLIEASLLLAGAAFIQRDPFRFLNPFRVKVAATSKGIQGFDWQTDAGIVRLAPENVIYLRTYNPDSDLGPGVAAVEVALSAAGIIRAAHKWMRGVFNSALSGAVLMLDVEGGSEADLERVRQEIDRILNSEFPVLAVRGLSRVYVLGGDRGEDINVAAELQNMARQEVAAALGVPAAMFGVATVGDADHLFRQWFCETIIIPECQWIGEELNAQWLNPQGLELVWRFERMPTMQEVQATKASYLVGLMQAGIIDRRDARKRLGYDD